MNRRQLFAGAAIGATGSLVAACDKATTDPKTVKHLSIAEQWSKGAQRAIIGRHALAPEFKQADISKVFKANGTTNPLDDDYQALLASGFAGWRLVIDGLVETPLSLTLDQVRALPSRTQITRHDCVEGWSSIGQWKGAKLSDLLDQVKLKPETRFLVFHCMDSLGAADPDPKKWKYYESIDLTDARHAQTILAYEMNGRPLPVAHGAPLRLRVERQLGYKQAKYVQRIEAVASLRPFGGGAGGFWEDRGYEWYAGI
ncbi:MAG: molybdopterin-binding protein [Alphaproteobacteria bacterium]